MGNTCSCSENKDEKHQLPLDPNGTPRVDTKPEKLPTLTSAVKKQNQIIKNERGLKNSVKIN